MQARAPHRPTIDSAQAAGARYPPQQQQRQAPATGAVRRRGEHGTQPGAAQCCRASPHRRTEHHCRPQTVPDGKVQKTPRTVPVATFEQRRQPPQRVLLAAQRRDADAQHQHRRSHRIAVKAIGTQAAGQEHRQRLDQTLPDPGQPRQRCFTEASGLWRRGQNDGRNLMSGMVMVLAPGLNGGLEITCSPGVSHRLGVTSMRQ
jgi:hypothetical protein